MLEGQKRIRRSTMERIDGYRLEAQQRVEHAHPLNCVITPQTVSSDRSSGRLCMVGLTESGQNSFSRLQAALRRSGSFDTYGTLVLPDPGWALPPPPCPRRQRRCRPIIAAGPVVRKA